MKTLLKRWPGPAAAAAIRLARLFCCGLLLPSCFPALADPAPARPPAIPSKPPTIPMNEASAPEHVRKHFTASVLPRREADPRIAAAADLVMKPPLPPSVTRRPAAEIAKSLADIGAKGKDSPIFDGSLKALAGKTNCLLVHYHGLLGGGVAACVDIPTGEILAMWQLPEG